MYIFIHTISLLINLTNAYFVPAVVLDPLGGQDTVFSWGRLWREINFHSFHLSEFMRKKKKNKPWGSDLTFKWSKFYKQHRTHNLTRPWLGVFVLILGTHALAQILFAVIDETFMFCLKQDNFLNATHGRCLIPCKILYLPIKKCFNVALLHFFQVLHKSWSILFTFFLPFWENGKWKRSQRSHSVGRPAIPFRNGK